MTNRSHFKSGISRHQPSFLPARIEDYVDRTNLVRAIDAYGDAVDPTPSNSSANWLLLSGRDLIRRAPALPRPKEPES